MRLPDEPDIPPQINIVAMIDVVFAILTFFIFSSLSLTSAGGGLPVDLPSSQTSQQGQTQADADIVINIDSQGQINVNGKQVDITNLTQVVQGIVGNSEGKLVAVSADKNSNYGNFVAVMDSLRQVPGLRIAVETQQ